MNKEYHIPALLRECMEGLKINAGGTYVDVTFGGGGHSREILKSLNENGRLIAFDQDEESKENLIDDERFTFISGNFRYLKNHLRMLRLIPVDGVLADLGVSSHHFDSEERGFSTRFDARLDMRMDKNLKLDAWQVVNKYGADELRKVFSLYGELKNAKLLANTIVEARELNPINTTAELKETLLRFGTWGKENKFFAQVFQALRIEVNKELEVLEEFLSQSAEVLKPGGRLVVISYHSLEDRLVKNFMKRGKFEGDVEKDFYGNQIKPFKTINGKPITPGAVELKMNSRSRSAKLRIAEKL